MSEQDLHDEPLVEPDPDPEALVDEADELERLEDDDVATLEADEADLVDQLVEADPGATTEDDYPPH